MRRLRHSLITEIHKYPSKMTAQALTLPRKTVQTVMAFAQEKPQDVQVCYITSDLRFAATRPNNNWAVVVTHPDQNTQPTPSDLAQAEDDELLLVLSLNTKGVLEIQAWENQRGQRQAVELKI